MGFKRTNSLRAARNLYRDVRGYILRLPSGVICVPTVYRGDGYWSAIPVGGPHVTYGAGAWDISVHTDDIDEAERIEVQ
jgi:hypothetical protein